MSIDIASRHGPRNVKSIWCLGAKKFYGKRLYRCTTFFIDEKGKIVEVISKVKTKDHAAQILAV